MRAWPDLVPATCWALFLDVDGTLLDLAATPESVAVPAELGLVLDRVSERLGGALALVSGRPLAALDRFFPSQLPAAAEHGAVIRFASHRPPEIRIASVVPEELRRQVERIAREHGARFEGKQTSAAVHYRQRPEAGPALERALRALLTDRPDVVLMPGKRIWEVRSVETSKGTAVETFLEREPFAGRIPLFAGDDATDEDGFVAAERHGGIALPVAGEPKLDALRGRPPKFAGPAEVRAWLAEIATGTPIDLPSGGPAAEESEVECPA